jgi:hypothetical protein
MYVTFDADGRNSGSSETGSTYVLISNDYNQNNLKIVLKFFVI